MAAHNAATRSLIDLLSDISEIALSRSRSRFLPPGVIAIGILESGRQRCRLWVISGHCTRTSLRPLYSQKRTSFGCACDHQLTSSTSGILNALVQKASSGP